jgi:DNA-binding FadR family transcriptional regulator
MDRVETSPAVRKAYDFLKGNLDRGAWQPGMALPSTRTLERIIGVSRNSILPAVARLTSEGRIHTMRRGRIRAGSESTATVLPPDHAKAVWRLKRAALEKDMLSGVFAQQGRLPSLKELQIRYGTCFVTMRKIMRSLVDDGVVRLRKRAYERIIVARHPFHRRIVFVTFATSLPRISALNQGQYRVLDLLEQECIRRELTLDIVEVDFDNSIESRKAIDGPAINAPALGYVLDLWWYQSEEFRRSHVDLIARVSALRRPLAILDEIGDFGLPAPFTTNPLIQVFRIEGKKAGARMARLLIGMGHQSIAYLSPVHEHFWSRQRLDGVLEQYAASGCEDGVAIVVDEKIEITHEHSLAVSGFSDRLIRKILGLGRSAEQANEMYRAFVRFNQTFSPTQWNKEDIREIRNDLGIIRDLEKRKPSMKLFERVNHEVFADIGIIMALRTCTPLFERALAHREATAWICASDRIALTALTFLQNRNKAVPRDLSIVGFDNQPEEAAKHRLATFDFNAHGFVHRMLNYIARPPRPRGPYHHVPIEVEGVVMQRGTAAPQEKIAGRR